MDAKYWDEIYRNKSEQELSWFQAVPKKSLELISTMELEPSDKIIDIGGGDSRLADHLLEKGFTDIAILDISSAALERAKKRLGEKNKSIKFIDSDVRSFSPSERYKLWHDRATFHFLTKIEDVEAYLRIANQAVVPGGYLIVSTFSKTGPEVCSGLPVTQYGDSELKALFGEYFTNIHCIEDTHTTPWDAAQNFVYCGFKRAH